MPTSLSDIPLLQEASPQPIGLSYWLRLVLIVLLLFVFLVATELLGESLAWIGKANFQETLYAMDNAFVGLFIGLLLTALLQSSSTVTAMTVAFVASGMLTINNAIPVIMGANIGTTITCIIVALGHITRKKEFKRGIAAALTHNFFNIFTTIVLFPLEYFTGALSKSALWLAAQLSSRLDLGHIGILDITISPIAKWLLKLCEGYHFLSVGIAVLLLLISVRGFTKLSQAMVSRDKSKIETLLFGTPLKSLLWGTIITAAIRSSSATTSIVVPLVAANRITIQNAFCFIMGANIGTTVTAILAALSKSEAALSIALVHLLFNVFGALLFFPFAPLQNLAILCAKTLGKWSFEYRLIGFLYLLFIFFVLPFVLILLTK
jgi:solute carrier family 34 (sodium-dependent phosphate cotransporter)